MMSTAGARVHQVEGLPDLRVGLGPGDLALEPVGVLAAQSQNSAESPRIAPSAPMTTIGARSSLPLAATVAAAFSVVSPGKIGITASSAISTNTEK